MNSIKAENTLKKELIRWLREFLEKEFISIEDFKEESAEILSKLEYSVSILETSWNLLEFMLQDLLDYS
jgi:hypothetical protein